jgi:hypothetical protein
VDQGLKRIVSGTRGALSGVAVLALLVCSGCVVRETKPLPKLNPVQATHEIPADEQLQVCVHPFEPGIPPGADVKTLDKQRISPDIRKAESVYFATLLRTTLDSSGQWGDVWVAPDTVQFVDVVVTGRILASSGAKLALEVTVKDSTGRVWINARHYESPADAGSYKSEAALKLRDPFQNLYSQISNDMLAARDALTPADRRGIRRVTQLEFDRDLAPQAMGGYLAKDSRGLVKVARLPAGDDPIALRAERIRKSDLAVVETVNGYYVSFSEQMSESYGEWRRASDEEIEKEQRALTQARARTYLGAAAVLASLLVPNQCGYNYSCLRMQSAVRYGAAISGTAAFISGMKKYSDAKVHAQTLKEMSETFQSEVASQVVDVEGRTLKLTGTADEQYREWRKLLQDLYLEENGTPVRVAPTPESVTPPVPVAADAAH